MIRASERRRQEETEETLLDLLWARAARVSVGAPKDGRRTGDQLQSSKDPADEIVGRTRVEHEIPTGSYV